MVFFSEINYEEYSDIWKYKQLAELIKSNKISKFDKGVYYVPNNSAPILDPQKVIDKKYIHNNDEYYGYYSGYSFLNNIGLSTQVPFVVELYTNNETSKIREIFVGKIKVILRKARVPINSSNVEVLSFLEMMNYVDKDFINDYRLEIIKKFINEFKVNREDIAKYSPYFPDKVMRNLVETGVIYYISK